MHKYVFIPLSELSFRLESVKTCCMKLGTKFWAFGMSFGRFWHKDRRLCELASGRPEPCEFNLRAKFKFARRCSSCELDLRGRSSSHSTLRQPVNSQKGLTMSKFASLSQ